MKKFEFRLQTVVHYKETIEKKQQAELAKAIAALNALLAEEERLQAALRENAASLNRALAAGRDIPAEMERHDLHRQFLRDQLEELKKRIIRAEAEKKRAQALLIATMKELKALERLREEQYQAYLEEVRQEEDKLIGDLISYHSAIGPQ